MNPVVDSPPITLASLLAPGVAAAQRYWKPFLLLQASAFLLVFAYYTNGTVRAECEQLSTFEQRGGLVFAAIAAAFAGAILPELAKAIMLGDRKITTQRLRDIGFNMVTFGICGIIVNVQYRAFGVIFGDAATFPIVLKKMLVDQFITTPIYGTPYWLFVFSLRAHRYHPIPTIREISPGWYLRKVMPLQVPAWVFWIPMVSLIYSLPGPLQFCLYCFAIAAWSLLMVFVAKVETNV